MYHIFIAQAAYKKQAHTYIHSIFITAHRRWKSNQVKVDDTVKDKPEGSPIGC
jgi:hypothetical protein